MSWRAGIQHAAARQGHFSGEVTVKEWRNSQGCVKGAKAVFTQPGTTLLWRKLDSDAGIGTCSRAATCLTTRWCTRPTGSSPSTASPSSALPSATSILASLIWSAYFSLKRLPEAKTHICDQPSKIPRNFNGEIMHCRVPNFRILSDPCQLYFTFRAFYLQFCSKLHEVSSDRQGILSLCALFEQLVSDEPLY